MTDRPIIMSAPMVRAVLGGRKTQTRRAIKAGPYGYRLYGGEPRKAVGWRLVGDPDAQCSIYAPGDRLWVRETWAQWPLDNINAEPKRARIYRATDSEPSIAGVSKSLQDWWDHKFPWRNPLFMPRWASRLTLTVTDVRVQRVQDISEYDAEAEGAEPMLMDDDGSFFLFPDGGRHRTGFSGLWDHLNAKRGFGWIANPWVVALTFSAEQRNIDA